MTKIRTLHFEAEATVLNGIGNWIIGFRTTANDINLDIHVF